MTMIYVIAQNDEEYGGILGVFSEESAAIESLRSAARSTPAQWRLHAFHVDTPSGERPEQWEYSARGSEVFQSVTALRQITGDYGPARKGDIIDVQARNVEDMEKRGLISRSFRTDRLDRAEWMIEIENCHNCEFLVRSSISDDHARSLLERYRTVADEILEAAIYLLE